MLSKIENSKMLQFFRNSFFHLIILKNSVQFIHPMVQARFNLLPENFFEV